MERSMTSLDNAGFPYETAPRANETRTYNARLPIRHGGALFSGLDKIGLSLATLMALGPLAATAWGTYVMGA